MQPEAPGLVAPRFVDGPLEEIAPQASANELRHEAKLHQFNLAVNSAVQFGKASGDAVSHQDVNFESGVVQEGTKVGVCKLLAAGPVVISPHGVVQEAVIGNT